MRRVLVLLAFAGLVLAVSGERPLAACTIGVAHGKVTQDERPMLWKSRMWGGTNIVVRTQGPEHLFLGVKSMGDSQVNMGVNVKGLATGNSLVGSAGGNWAFMGHCLGTFKTVQDVRDFLENGGDISQVSGCFPFIDATGDATMFEIDHGQYLEYWCLNEAREAQDMLGWVVRANEFHWRADGTDDLSIGGRYLTARFNTDGLVDLGKLSCLTIMQGWSSVVQPYEFMRYGPGLPLPTIALPEVCSSMAMHGVAPNEEPRLSTMWIGLGEANYCIAVPTWVIVEDIPDCLENGDMVDRTEELYAAGNEELTQQSVFPVEAHLYAEVEELLQTWRPYFSLAERDLQRVETVMTDDAYSLMWCLTHIANDNLAPSVTIQTAPLSRAFVRFNGDHISIDDLVVVSPPEVVYFDDFSTHQAEHDSYDHSVFWPEMAFPPPEPYLFYTHFVQPPGALAFMKYDGVPAHLAYQFLLPPMATARPYLKVVVYNLGEGYGSYSLSGNGQTWTLPMPLRFGENRINLIAGVSTAYRFTADASDPDGTVVSYSWNFGDGATATGQSVQHAYARPGRYLVSCTVTDDQQVQTTDWMYLNVRMPVAEQPDAELHE